MLSPIPELETDPIDAFPLRTSWGTTRSEQSSALVQKLLNYIYSARDLGRVRTLDAYITPTWRTFFSFTSWSSIQGRANRSIKDFLQGLTRESASKLNIVALDRLSQELTQTIIGFN